MEASIFERMATELLIRLQDNRSLTLGPLEPHGTLRSNIHNHLWHNYSEAADPKRVIGMSADDSLCPIHHDKDLRAVRRLTVRRPVG